MLVFQYVGLFSKVVSKGEARHFGTHQFNVRLFDIELEFDVDIIQELIVRGHGRPSKELVYVSISLQSYDSLG